ncbi:MAG: hypothetical protein ACR2NM_14780, partial [Bythopirellula sp.]
MPYHTSEWWRRIYPHNPLYLVSAALVLYGIHVVSLVQNSSENDLTTSLLFAYVIMLATAGWLVVRFGHVWEDARTILLIVFLMFTAISTSYDFLCLNDPIEGARRLALSFGFCCAVVEVGLGALRIRLPLVYRVPFYVQLLVLFAFPAVLGQLSIDGHVEQMCLGVMAFSTTAGGAILLLLPAVALSTLRDEDNGTPWPWPHYPWSIFVMMAIALAVRLWMLSVSFTNARGLDPAFHPYFLSPLLMAISIIILAASLKHHSLVLQRVAMVSLPAIIALSFPGKVSRAQAISLEFLESSLAGPPFLTAVTATAIGLLAALRNVSWSRITTFVCLLATACLDPHTRWLDELQYPQLWFQFALLAWLSWRGVWQLSMPYLSTAAALALGIAATQFTQSWVTDNNALLGFLVWSGWTLTATIFCRDQLSSWLRTYGPALLSLLAMYIVLTFPPAWWVVPREANMYLVITLVGFSLA